MKAPSPNPWTTAAREQLRRPLFREPLLYFLLVGVAVFGVDHLLRTDDRVIRVTPSIRTEIARAAEINLGRPAEANELQAAIESWKREEALYREGLKMHLLEKDSVVRSHLASKLLEIGRTRNVLPEPTEAELRSYLERHRDRFTPPTTYDFDQVFVARSRSDARAQAEQLLTPLRQGVSPEKLGDPFLLGHRISEETLSRLSELIGDQLAKELPGYAIGEWNLVEGLKGIHLVRVTRVNRQAPDFDKLREGLALMLKAEKQEDAAQAFAREIESRYRFVSSE